MTVAAVSGRDAENMTAAGVLDLSPAGPYGTSAVVRRDGLLHPKRPTPAEPGRLGMADRVCGKPKLPRHA